MQYTILKARSAQTMRIRDIAAWHRPLVNILYLN
jgi:hypothetical protein